MDALREAQKHTVELAMWRGSSSVFGLLGRLLADVQEHDLDDATKWKIWQDTCRRIARKAGEEHERWDGCKVSEIKNLFQVIFGAIDGMNVERFDEVLRYTEYCRRMALFGAKSNDHCEPLTFVAQDSNIKKQIRDSEMGNYDVTDPRKWELISYQLSDNIEMSNEGRRQLAHNVQRSLIRNGLWDDKKNREKKLQVLRKVISDILSPK